MDGFESNSFDIYSPHSSPNPWRKSTKAGEHEAGRIFKKIGAGEEEEEGCRARGAHARLPGDDVSKTSSFRQRARVLRGEPGSILVFGSVQL